MNIALFAVPGVLAPLQGLWRRFRPAAQGRPTDSGMGRHACDVAIYSIANNTCYTGVEPKKHSDISVRRSLRIVRILEAGQAPAHAGRMVISGRMADVCAELDRLAAREAALH